MFENSFNNYCHYKNKLEVGQFGVTFGIFTKTQTLRSLVHSLAYTARPL